MFFHYKFLFSIILFLIVLTFFYGDGTSNKNSETVEDKDIVTLKISNPVRYFEREKILQNETGEIIQKTVEKNKYSFQVSLFNAGLDPNDFEEWFKEGEPKAIHYWKDGELVIIKGLNSDGTGKGINKILNISDDVSIDEVKRERTRKFNQQRNNATNVSASEVDKYQIIAETMSQVFSFNPGFRDDGKNRIVSPENISFSIQGPDHSFDAPDDLSDIESLKNIMERTISLGHKGEIIIKVKGNGWILNREGADFIIYENPFRFGWGLIYQEFAYVGVSETNDPESYRWFSCNPEEGNIGGCAGVVPTDEGGDQFDLSSLGFKKIRYIKIKDTGLNHNNYGGKNTEGFDLDALSLIHGYKKIKK